jgi:ABC-type oligopeptide transport system substrate-binding subunit
MRRAFLGGLAAAALIAAIATAGATASGAQHASAKAGGQLTVDVQSDFDFVDPALDYLASGWEMTYATCLKLMNYPDKNGPQGSQLIPEAAAGFPKVSNNGKTYDFTVNASFTKFSNGQPVTAANFKAAFDRDIDPKMQSPAPQFLTDVVGEADANAGKAASASGITVKGNHLIIKLTRAAPDFLARLAMPFFCAIPTNLQRDPNGLNVYPSAGPYYIAARTPNRSVTLKQNPYYKGKRPHNVSQINYVIGNALSASELRVESGQADYTASGIPPADYANVAQKYGVNKQGGQFYSYPILRVNYIAMNTNRPLFKNNLALRKAVNYAIDRHALLMQSGFLAGKRTDQILPPGLAGFKDADLYPLKGPNLPLAKKLAAGHTGDGKAILYTANAGSYPLRAQIIQYNLKQIGIDVTVDQFTRGVQITKTGNLGEPFDLSDTGWQADYADPFDFINILLDGSTIQQSNNTDISYFNDPTYIKQMHQAALLTGKGRDAAYGNLDINIMKNAAPWASFANSNLRMLVSKRWGCFTFSAVYQNDLAAACVK